MTKPSSIARSPSFCLLGLIARGVGLSACPNGHPNLLKALSACFRSSNRGVAKKSIPPYGYRAIAEINTPCIFRGCRVAKLENP